VYRPTRFISRRNSSPTLDVSDEHDSKFFRQSLCYFNSTKKPSRETLAVMSINNSLLSLPKGCHLGTLLRNVAGFMSLLMIDL
jgi:hypothetical protein